MRHTSHRKGAVAVAGVLLATPSIVSSAWSQQQAPRHTAAAAAAVHETMLKSSQKNEPDPSTTTISEKVKAQTWNPLRLAVLKLGATEPMGTSPLNYGSYNGTFACAFCGHALFDSEAKYDSRSGWPSFWRSIKEGAVSYKREMDGRTECSCECCGSHLGHVFPDGPLPSQVDASVRMGSPESDPRGKDSTARLPRFCINGASLKYRVRSSS
jgi:peptide-methionine (R)-S-oxide reductase